LGLFFLLLNIVHKCLRKYKETTLRPHAFISTTGIAEKLIDTRKNRSGADPFVIALAKVEGCGVVTGEKPTNHPERPKIPDVCRAIGIPCINILQLCREQKWVFDLRD